MKKNYTSPAIEMEIIAVEQGIALSDRILESNVFDLGEEAKYEEYNGGAAIWQSTQSLTISKKRKEMKKIFYILASAIVALGAVACDNQDLDNIAPSTKGEGLSFSATIDNTKVGLDGLQTIWTKGDQIVFEGYEDYKFVCNDDCTEFTCETEGVKEALGDKSGLIAWYNKGGIDSAAGTAGAQLKATGCSFKELNPSFTFEVQNAFLKFTTKGTFTDPFVITAEGLFSDENGEISGVWSTTEVKEHYVAIKPTEGETKITYSIGGVTQKETSLKFNAGVIYNLGELTATASNFGIFGKHQNWDEAKPEALYLIPNTNTYARMGVTLQDGTDDGGFKLYSKGVDIDMTPYVLLKLNSNWSSAGWIAVYTFDSESDYKWYKMESALNGYYGIEISNLKGKLIFCRMNDGNTSLLDWSNKWDQTNNLEYKDSKNLYTIASGAWSYGSGSWSKVATQNTGKIYIGTDKNVATNASWDQRWSNNGGQNNIKVSDFSKSYDIYLNEGTHQMWGFEVYHQVVEHGNTPATLK